MKKNKLFYSLIFLALISVLLFPISNFDIFWQLKTGEIILKTLSIPHFTLFNFNQQTWIDHEWLSQIILFLIYKIAGFNGLIILRIVFFLSILYFTLKSFFAKYEFSVLHSVMFSLFFIIFSTRVWIRPEIFSLFFLILFYERLSKNDNLEWYYYLLFVAWVNMHPYFILGVFLFFVGYIFKRNMKTFKNLLFTILAGIVNPYHINLYKRILLEQTTPFVKNIISEWNSIFYFLQSKDFNFNVSLFLVFSLVFFAFFIRKLIKARKLSQIDVICFVLLLLSFSSIRFIPVFLIFSLYFFRDALPVYKNKFIVWWLLLILIVLSFSGYIFSITKQEKYLGFGLNRQEFPNSLITFIEKKAVGRKRVLADFDLSGYLSFYFYPHQKYFIDPSYITENNLMQYVKILRMRPFEINDLDIDLIVLNYRNGINSEIIKFLRRSKVFSLVYIDHSFVVFDKTIKNTFIPKVNADKEAFVISTFLIKYRYFEIARKLIMDYLKGHTGFPEIYNNLAVVSLHFNDFKNAEKYINKSLKLNPHKKETLQLQKILRSYSS